MAWLSRVNFVSSDTLSFTDINNLGNDIRAWGDNVNGGGYTLSNVALSASSGTMATVTGGTGAASTLTIRSTSGTGTSDAIVFQTASQSERMRITTGGNVGIGTASPGEKLVVVGNIVAGNTGTTADGYIDIDSGAAGKVRISRTGTGATASGMVFYTQFSTLQERMRILSTGEVGIGTSSPSQKLDVVGNLLLSGQSTADQYIKVGSSRSGNGYSYVDLQGDTTYGYGTRLIRGNTGANSISSLEHRGTGDLRIVNYEAAPICFYTSSSEKVRIDSSGNVGIGTASPAALLHVASGTTTSLNLARIYAGSLASGNAVDMYIGKAASPNQSGTFGFNYNSTSTSSYAYMSIYGDSSTTGITVTPGGKVGIGKQQSTYSLEISADSAAKPGAGGLWTVVSDERIKTNIIPADLDRCYEIVRSVPLKHYGFAPGVYGENQIQDKHNLGWIAQDVQKVFKNAVSTKPFTLHNNEVIQDCLDLNSGQLIAALYGAVQSLMQKVEELQRKI